jgi:cell volume regulation protein A
VIAPPAQAAALDELFAERRTSADAAGAFGEFTFGGELPVGKIAEFYDLPVPEAEKATPLADFVRARLGRKPLIGDRIRFADVELVAQAVRDERIVEVAIDLEPRMRRPPSLRRLRAWLRHALARPRRVLGKLRPRAPLPPP